MNSTKSFLTFAVALATFSLSTAAPIADSDAGHCSLDITMRYKNNNQKLSHANLPFAFKTVFSATSDVSAVFEDVPRHPHQLRDIRFHVDHGDHDNKIVANDNQNDERVFGAFIRMTAPVPCSTLPLDKLLDPINLAHALPATASILALHAIPSPNTAELASAAPLTVTGTASVLIADYLDGSSDKWAEVETESGEVVVVGGPNSVDAVELAEWSALRTGDEVELVVEGVAVGGHGSKAIGSGMGAAFEHAKARHRLLAITRRTPKQETEDKVSPAGAISLIAIRIKFTDFDPDTLCDTACMETNLWTGQYNVNGAYQDASFGAISIPQSLGTIVTVTVPVASTSFACSNLAGVSTAAESALASQFPNIVLSSYKVKVYFTPSICAIGIAYLGSTPGKAYINSKYPDTIAHEVGHTFNMQHANRDPGDDNTVDEYYGDRSCIMGYSQVSLRGFNVPHRIDSGWIPASAIMDLASTCSTTPEIITLSAVSMATTPGATVALRAVRRNLGRYFISFRNRDGYDGLQTSSYANHVHIHYQIGAGAQTQLITVLAAGQTWTQADGDLTVTVNAVQSSEAIVAVTYCRPTSFRSVVGTLTCGSALSGTNVGASNLVGYSSGDVLYQVAFQAGVTYTISTCGSTLDTVLRFYTDAMQSQISYCDNCGGCSSNVYNAVLSKLSPGTGNYFISLEGFNLATGSYVISMTCSGTPTAVSTTPTASRSPAPTTSPSISAIPSASKSASKSAVPSVSSTPAASRSPAASPSRSASASTSGAPLASKSPAAQPSPVAVEIASPSGTPTASDAPSRSVSTTPAPSHSASGTPSQEPTASPSGTASRTASPSASQSRAAPTPSTTPSHTAQASASRTATKTATRSPTRSRSPSPSPVIAAAPTDMGADMASSMDMGM